MRVVMDGGQYQIFASGEIDAGAAERFQKFVRDTSIDDAIVLFDSSRGCHPRVLGQNRNPIHAL